MYFVDITYFSFKDKAKFSEDVPRISGQNVNFLQSITEVGLYFALFVKLTVKGGEKKLWRLIEQMFKN